MRNILEIKNLVVSYGGIEAVKGIDLNVEEGKIVTLIGSNGAGKSTTLKAIAGLVKPRSGEILLNGANLIGKSTDQIVSSGVTLVPEGRRVFSNLTVEENLRIGAYLRKDSLADDLARVYDLFPRLKEREWQQAGTLSGGEQQMLAVGRALMARPKLIMMDEPSLGLAPIVVRGIFEIIREINRQGITVLLIEQNANMALKIADWAYVMQTGVPAAAICPAGISLSWHRKRAPASSRARVIFFYLISCSNASNSGVEKNSPSVIAGPTHSFLIYRAMVSLVSTGISPSISALQPQGSRFSSSNSGESKNSGSPMERP